MDELSEVQPEEYVHTERILIPDPEASKVQVQVSVTGRCWLTHIVTMVTPNNIKVIGTCL